MRSFEDIRIASTQAMNDNDAAALQSLAKEMKALGTMEAEAFSFKTLGDSNLIAGHYAQALDHYRQALSVFEGLHDRNGVAQVANNMGLVCADTGDYSQALEYYRLSMAAYEELGIPSGIALVNGNLAVVYVIASDFPQALECYRRSIAIHEELGDRSSVAVVTGNMGTVYASTGDHSLALDCFRRALEVHEELGRHIPAAQVTSNMGLVYANTGDYSQALENYQKAMSTFEALNDQYDLTNIIGSVAQALIKLDRLDEAADILDRQATMQMSAPTTISLHKANRALLAEKRDDLDAAQSYLVDALGIATDADIRSQSTRFHEMLRDLAKKRNDFEGYIHHNAEYQRINEEIRGKEATKKMAMQEAERKAEAVEREREKERALLYGALPESVATRMLRGESVSGDHFEGASVIFLDIAGFTAISDKIPPGHVVHLLEQIFSVLDEVVDKHGVTKIKTIGDSYMAVAGVPEPLDDHAQRAAACALEMLSTLEELEITMPTELGDTSWVDTVDKINVRIGVHCGPVTAGVIGTKRLQYDVWGDTVNVASRMESSGEAGRIQVSEAFALVIPNEVKERGSIDIKGKGQMKTFWLDYP